MDNTTSYCLNPRCGLFGKGGPAARLKRYDWQRAGPQFECKACGSVLSASTGTAYAGVRTDLNTYRRGSLAGNGWASPKRKKRMRSILLGANGNRHIKTKGSVHSMKANTIRTHFKPYQILGKRKTTINHAFASVIAPNDAYDEELLAEAIRVLGQDPHDDLMCAYCGQNPAETWDHVVGLVKNQQFSGFGHTLGNLLPCCKSCNSSKGNRNWRAFVIGLIADEESRGAKIAQLESYFARFGGTPISLAEIDALCPDEMSRLRELRQEIYSGMKEADAIAVEIRRKIRESLMQRADHRTADQGSIN